MKKIMELFFLVLSINYLVFLTFFIIKDTTETSRFIEEITEHTTWWLFREKETCVRDFKEDFSNLKEKNDILK